MTGLEYHCKR